MKFFVLVVFGFNMISCVRGHQSSAVSTQSDKWRAVFVCENDEAVVNQDSNDPTRFQLILKNNDLNMYLGLGYLARTEGEGASIAERGGFVGFASIVSRFNNRDPNGRPLKIAHVFPESDGLRVKVETEAHYFCDYDFNYGDNSGNTHTIFAEIGRECPNLSPHYSFRRARGGSDVQTNKNWYFQKCRAVE